MKLFTAIIVLFFGFMTARFGYHTWKQDTKPASIAIFLLAAAYPAIGIILIMR